MSLSDVELGQPRRLAHLPLVMDVLRRSRIVEIIDEACGVDQRMKVSHGECVAFIIAGVFAGESGLWRLRDRLDVFDMATVMQDPGICLDEYYDGRLGRACDALYHAGPDRIQTALGLYAIEAWELDRSYLHVDTTSLTFYGAYEEEGDTSWSPEIDGLGDTIDGLPSAHPKYCVDRDGNECVDGDGRPSPRIVHGYAKNHRHDLKQILYGSVVTRDGGVPLYGRAMDGNTSDVTAATEFLDHLRSSMTSEPESCFVTDCKGWTGRVLRQVHDHRLRLLSRLPRSTKLAQQCVDDFDCEQAPCLLKKYSRARGHWSWVSYQGTDAEYTFSVTRTHTREDGETYEEREDICLPVRVVTCFSSALYRQKVKTLQKTRQRELTRRAATVRRLEKPRWHCEQDAQRAADRLHAHQPFTTLTLSAVVTLETVTDTRKKKGRPKKDAPAPTTRTRYRLIIAVTSADAAHTDARLRRAATNVLIRNRLIGWTLSDEEMVAAYSDQWRVEHGFAWLKSGAAINPMYLESPRRIAALSMIYHIALMIHTLIQRGIRKGLKERQWELPYHRNKPSDNITARFLYELFRNVSTQCLSTTQESEKRCFGMDEHTQRALIALGVDPQAYKPVIHESEK